MTITSKSQETHNNPSPINSLSNNNGRSSRSSNGSLQISTPPLTPKTISRPSESNPYPTTFVQADLNNFKQVVQMLTGSPETAKQAYKTSLNSDQQQQPPHPTKGFIPPIKTGQKKQGFKLYERRNSLKNGLMISPLIPHPSGRFAQNSSFSPRETEILSPSILDFPALVLSPVTPLNADPFIKSPSSIGSSSSSSEEEKAIAEKKFYLHPSPRTSTPRGSEPQLLPLFPVTSPSPPPPPPSGLSS